MSLVQPSASSAAAATNQNNTTEQGPWHSWDDERSPQQTQRAVQQVLEAIKGLPASFSKDYHTAMAQVPELMEQEANPIRYLRCCQGDPWQAAARMCQNLTLRRTVFGESDWLKPLRLQDGALTAQDVAFLRSGAFSILTPPAGSSSVIDRRQVFVSNYTRTPVNFHAHRARVAFYLCNTTINEYSQKHGIVVLLVLNSFGVRTNSKNGTLFQCSHTSSGFQIHQVILANDPHDTRLTLAHLCRITLRRMVEKFWGSGRLFNVSENTAAETVQRLMALGLHPSTIPNQLGGMFSYERDFKEWLAMRLVQEQVRGETRMSPLMQQPTTVADWLVILPSAPAVAQPDGDTSSLISVMGNEVHRSGGAVGSRGGDKGSKVKPASASKTAAPLSKVKELRKRNCEYSKRHYYKRKHEVEDLRVECETLKGKRQQLLDTHDHLVGLCHQAQAVVAEYHSVPGEAMGTGHAFMPMPSRY